jgi:hypothetical protein
MATIQSSLHIKGLGKQKMSAVIERAKSLGMTPERYLRHLVDEDLAVSRRAKSTTFEELLGPGERADEDEIDRLVEEARTRHYQSKARKR